MSKKACILWVLLLVISACAESTPPVRDFVIDDLLVDPSIFPSEWYVVAKGGAYDRKEKRALEGKSLCMETNLPNLTGANVFVYRYKNEQAASSAFDKWADREFNSSSIGSLTPWEVPGELPYQSPGADKSRFACHVNSISKTTVCKFMGQYEEFMVLFYTGFDGEHMTYADLERILQTIDERMAHYLKGEIP